MEKIFISIIVPVYNVEQYLPACLNSLVQLKFFAWEAILIDDGSIDNSGRICDEYAKRNHKFKVVHQKNKGVSAARNVGIDIAHGDWLWFVDSDDIINPNFVIDNLEVMKNADYVLFDFHTFKCTDVFEKITSHYLLSTEKFDKNSFLLHYRCNHHQRIFYRRNLLKSDVSDTILRFSTGIRVGEDLEFQYKYLTRCKKPIRLNAELYFYRLRDGSATQDENYRQKNVEDLPKVLKNILQWCKLENVQPEAWLEVRILQLFQNLLYSASLLNGTNTQLSHTLIRNILSEYKKYGFVFPHKFKMRLAYWNMKAYFLLNRVYLKVKK